MSTDKYAQHLIQKYKLAVAIAVIQTTPDTKSLDQHLLDLKNKFNDERANDSDVTICSDDFDVDFNENDINISLNSETILKDFDDTTVAENILLENNQKKDCPAELDLLQGIDNECRQDKNCLDDIQSTFCETQIQLENHLAPGSLTDIDKTFCDSIARIHQDYIMDIDRTCDEIAKIYKTTVEKVTSDSVESNTGTTYLNTDEKTTEKINKSYHNNKQKSNDIPNTQNLANFTLHQADILIDSQATELYTIPSQTQNYTHVSQSQTYNFDVSDKYIKGTNKNTTNASTNENTDDLINTDFSCVRNINLASKVNRNLDKQNVMQVEICNFDHNSQIVTDYREVNDKLTQSEVPYTSITNNSENIFPQHFKNGDLARKVCNNLDQNNVTINKDFEQNTHCNLNIQDNRINNKNSQDTQVIFGSVNDYVANPTHDHSNIVQTKQHTITTNNKELETTQNSAQLETSKNNTENITMQVYHTQNEQITSFNDINEEIIQENESESSEDTSQRELVPFKVMEELNRVKSYLNKRVERRMSNESSLDSGYRSDSQGWSSQGRKSGFQLSGNWVGQSGYCLYDHLRRCPLVNATEDIVADISEVLGQLIDTLHEQETYPSFLEELLVHVQSLIQSVFSEEDMVLDKDEKIQRLFLLNKSIHIQKYTVDKLTDILENMHTRLTNSDELCELIDIQTMENLSYIFHVLEVILRRCLKNKRNDKSQSLSQESARPKTSISDIWRKKWNPNYKEPKIDSSVEKKCVFKRCNEVLNKIVIGCMDGYSLVAFAALQCFNLLQS